MATPSPAHEAIHVEPVTSEADFAPLFAIAAAAFGTQIHDAIWTSANPDWDTPSGQQAHAARLVTRWRNVTRNQQGDPNTVFLKATSTSINTIVGFAIWGQQSFVPGWGDTPSTDFPALHELYPTPGPDREFTRQVFVSLLRDQVDAVRAKEKAEPPALFALELCAVDPGAQRRGVGQALVRWGLEEARRRGGLECMTQASVMGRGAYAKLGFKPVKEIVYEVDEEVLRGRTCPSNLLMRTGP